MHLVAFYESCICITISASISAALLMTYNRDTCIGEQHMYRGINFCTTSARHSYWLAAFILSELGGPDELLSCELPVDMYKTLS